MYQRATAVAAERGHTLDGRACGTCGDLDGCHRDRVRSVYVASSWRNDVQPVVVTALRDHGFAVYDFRSPEASFSWSSIDPDWLRWTPEQFAEKMQDPLALHGFRSDFDGMVESDACLMVQPCGVSAALEAAWFAGRGRPTAALLRDGPRFEPELMLGLLDALHTELADAIEWLRGASILRRERGRR